MKIKDQIDTAEKLTIQELALYLGCEVLVSPVDHFSYRSQITGVVYPDKVQLSSGMEYPLEVVKPLLKPLSTLNHSVLNAIPDLEEGLDLHSLETYWKNCASLTTLLLSEHYDLFDWIKKGFAIDKTKV